MYVPRKHAQLIKECAHIAKNAYTNDIQGHFLFAPETDTQSWVTLSDSEIIFSGQGTTTLKDWAIDFRIWRTKVDYLQNSQVHSGFVLAYNSIRYRMLSLINKHLTTHHNVQRIVCTGHSLFGAIATIAALDLSLQYNIPVHCVTFGSPRVGAKDFVKLFNNCVCISYRCVQYKDPVTFTPLPLRFKHVRGGLSFGSTQVALYNCVGCRIKHHSMDEYAEMASDLM